MPHVSAQQPPRPRLILRIGITGKRRLDANSRSWSALEADIRKVLEQIEQAAFKLASDPRAMHFYECEEDGVLVPDLVCLSQLAEGADRRVAGVAKDLGYKLYVPMPFPQKIYESSFARSEGEATFASLLKGAKSYALDGELDESGKNEQLAVKAYVGASHFLVRHCDLLLALWDGKPGNGPGGTADTVRFAAKAGVPVWWIDTRDTALPKTKPAPVWISDELDIDYPPTAAVDAEKKLDAYIKGLISVPPAIRHQPPQWIPHGIAAVEKQASRIWMALSGKGYRYPGDSAGIDHALNELYGIGRKHAGRHARRKGASSQQQGSEKTASAQNLSYWKQLTDTADALAQRYSKRYRWSYKLLFIFASLEVIFSAFAASAFAHRWGASSVWFGNVLEVSAILLIVALVGVAGRNRWHENSVEYRLLAELFRMQQMLWALGWALPIRRVEYLASEERGNWVAWLFAAAQRAAPPPSGQMDESLRNKSWEILQDLIAGQLVYHKDREEKAKRLGLLLDRLCAGSFLVVTGAAFFKFTVDVKGWPENWADIAVFAGAIFLALSAASAGFRSYAELRLLEDQSKHMQQQLKYVEARVECLKPHLHSASISQEVGVEALNVAALMLQDLDGWGRLFRGKLIDTA